MGDVSPIAQLVRAEQPEKLQLVGLGPVLPMGRIDIDAGLRFGLEPTTQNPSAGKDERVRDALLVDDCEAQIAIERRHGNRLPIGCLVSLMLLWHSLERHDTRSYVSVTDILATSREGELIRIKTCSWLETKRSVAANAAQKD